MRSASRVVIVLALIAAALLLSADPADAHVTTVAYADLAAAGTTDVRVEFDLGEVTLGNACTRLHGSPEDHRVRSPVGADRMRVDLLPGIQGCIGSTRVRIPQPWVDEAATVWPPADRLETNAGTWTIDELPGF